MSYTCNYITFNHISSSTNGNSNHLPLGEQPQDYTAILRFTWVKSQNTTILFNKVNCAGHSSTSYLMRNKLKIF